MTVSSGLALKGAGTLASVTAVSSGTYWLITNSDEVKRNEMTEYDRGLINYLENGGKIQFAVAVGNNSALTNDFPAFSSGISTITATVKIKTNGSSADAEGKLEDSEKAKKADLKELNGGKSGAEWTWTCEIKFIKKPAEGNINDLADDYRNKLVKEQSEKGFFNKLKEKEENKDLKIKFIRDCAGERNTEKNKKINKANNLSTTINNVINSPNILKSTKSFDLRVGETKNNGEITTKLYPVDKEAFNDWFSIGGQQ